MGTVGDHRNPPGFREEDEFVGLVGLLNFLPHRDLDINEVRRQQRLVTGRKGSPYRRSAALGERNQVSQASCAFGGENGTP
jgi:hypothetical protein